MKMFILILLVVFSTARAQSEASTAAGPGCDCCTPKFLQPQYCIEYCNNDPVHVIFCRRSLPSVPREQLPQPIIPKFPKDPEPFLPQFPEIAWPIFVNPVVTPDEDISCGTTDPVEGCCVTGIAACCAAVHCEQKF